MAAKYSEWNRGQDEALLNKLGGMEIALKLLDCREVTVTFNTSNKQATITADAPTSAPARSWREENGVIYFSVTSDGTSGPDWIPRLERKGFRVSKYAKSVLLSGDFQPTNGVTYEVAVLKGELFEEKERVTKQIRAEGDRRGWRHGKDMPAEIACLIRENFSDEELEAMGLWWIVAMHEPIKDSDGGPDLLSADRYDDGRWLHAYYDGPGRRWYREDGFAFVVSQVSAEASAS